MPSVKIATASNNGGILSPTATSGTGNLTFMCWMRMPDTEANYSTSDWGAGVNNATTPNAVPAIHAWPSGPDTDRRVCGIKRGTGRVSTSFSDTSFPSTGWVYVVIHLPTSGDVTIRMFADDSGLTLLGSLTRPNTNVRQPHVFITGGTRTTLSTAWKVFDGGSFTDAECRAQAATRDAVSHGSATLRDRWPLESHTSLTGTNDGVVLQLWSQSGTVYTTDSDEPAALSAPPAPAVARSVFPFFLR
jgi:hypothetical protein